jgi:CBS domain-containing protein
VRARQAHHRRHALGRDLRGARNRLNDVLALLIEHKAGALHVVQPDTREVLGIVSYIDVLRAIQDSLEEE